MPGASSESTLAGQCLCGAVKIRVRGPFGPMVHCYCGLCRKAHGSAFATFVAAPAAGFEWLAGQADVAGYASTPGSKRWFCRHCGAVTPEPDQPGPQVWMPAGLLDGDCGPPGAHMFTGSRLPWLDVDDGLPA